MYQGRDELDIIQEDIRRAMRKPNPQWGMLIDLRRCIGCQACTVGCISEQKTPPGVIYRPVYEEEFGQFPRVRRRFTPRPCMQCDNPPCVAACPNKGENGATWKGQDGVVRINYEQCIGCGRCVIACPYRARTLDGGLFYTENTPGEQAYEKGPSWEYGRKWLREAHHLPVGNARKCHFCLHRLRKGMVPMCVSTCIARANIFGDLSDPQSLISQMLNTHRVHVLKAVRTPGETPTTPAQLRGISPDALAKRTGYPGKVPVFAESAPTRPRVFYILPEEAAK
jgi:molybdopterin-containing oxidoreductase family iron-sulfur binding subunit